MPKKRHQNLYSKPQSTAPANLTSSRGNHDTENHGKSVNQLLADLRRMNLSGQQQPSSAIVAQITAPSVHPGIARIFELPDLPPPAPRRPARVDPRGRRLPAGPPPPRSWLSLSRHAPASSAAGRAARNYEHRPLPGTFRPEDQSLVDLVLRSIVLNWECQRHYNLYYLYSLPSHLREALIAHLSVLYEPGLSVSDLKIILQPQAPDEDESQDTQEQSRSLLNEDIRHLDLTVSAGRSLKFRELSNLLFVSSDGSGTPQDSWDSPETSTIPRPLLPNLTHLSLAINPEQISAVSWKQLLSFATHLPTLTHLSLAYWPEPSLTPNAKNASVVSPQGRMVQYGGTNAYSHSLDDDWSEAVVILRRLSKCLYGLEYLDLTGCSAWFKALMATASDDWVDWVSSWGKMMTLLLHTGYAPPLDDAGTEAEKYMESITTAKAVEKHIRAKRAGKGRIITVEKDKDLDVK